MLTMSSILDRARRVHGAQAGIFDRGKYRTWATHVDRVARVAGALQAYGLSAGDRVGIIGKNSAQFCELLHAGYWSGIIPVPINFRLAPLEMAFILKNANCRALAFDPAFGALLDKEELAEFRGCSIFLRAGDDFAGPNLDEMVDKVRALPRVEAGEDDDAILLYTGGTTGRAKGVRLTHRNIVSNGLQVGATLGIRHDDVYLHVAPMFHSADLLATAVTLAGGAHAYLADFNPRSFLSAIQETRATVTMLAPTMLIMVLQCDEIDSSDLSSLRIQVYGSAPMSERWIRLAIEKLPHVQVTQGYGLTETAPILTFLEHRHHLQALDSKNSVKLGSAGKPLPGVDMLILDENGTELPVGESGEVVVRGPNVTPGYHDLPDLNDAAFQNGWFKTGDIGVVDTEGHLFLLDRKKDMIVTGGENVYSSEVEAVLQKHADIEEVAVIGVPDELYGEAVCAIIVTKSSSQPTEADIISFCRGWIAGYKIPRKFRFVTKLPKSPLGKILKSELRQNFS